MLTQSPRQPSRHLIPALFLIFSLAFSPTAMADIINLTPAADAYVLSDSPALNTGNYTWLRSYHSGSVDYYAYLKFNLTGIPAGQTIKALTLYLYKFSNDGSHDSIIDLHAVPNSNDGWSESGTSGITWNNKPGFDATIQDSVTITTTAANGWFSWDIPSFQAFTGDGVLSLVLDAASTGYGASFWSKDNSSNKPYLAMETMAVPLPGAGLLVGSGLLGLLGFRRLRKP